MPFKIHEAAARKQMEWNISRPQEVVQKDIPENWQSTPGRGLPVLEIPFFHFPCVLYLHPNQATKTVVHRNQAHEIVEEEEVPLEHLTRTVYCDLHKEGGPKDCAACTALLERALSEGWVTKPYIPVTPVKPDADLYGPRKKK